MLRHVAFALGATTTAAFTIASQSIIKAAKEDCPQIAGQYLEGSSGRVSLTQSDCDAYVDIKWPGLDTKSQSNAKISGNDIEIDGFRSVGHVDSKGDIAFDDGGRWMKLVEEKENGAVCLPPAQLLFLHVMKNGGTSVDRFLSCHCHRAGCGFKLSLGTFLEYYGRTECSSPSVCSTHGDLRNRETLCGSNFQDVKKTFTVFREPAGRAFSFYNYEKSKKPSMPSLLNLLAACDEHEGEDQSGFNTTSVRIGDEIFSWKTTNYWCSGLTNHMTLSTFAKEDTPYARQVGAKEDSGAAVAEAMEVVHGLAAIFFIEDLAQFPQAFDDSGLLPKVPDENKCRLEHANPTKCDDCSDKPTEEEEEALLAHNRLDTKLYEYAKKLPNAFHGV